MMSWMRQKLFNQIYRCFVSIMLLLVVCVSVTGCMSTEREDDPKIYTDVEFVQGRFPKMEEIQSVRYFYYDMNKNADREIGMYPKKFAGLIHVGDTYAAKIAEECEWEECDVTPEDVLTEGENYHFLFSDDFGCGTEYVTETVSFVGDFYFDKEKQVIYFTGEY